MIGAIIYAEVRSRRVKRHQGRSKNTAEKVVEIHVTANKICISVIVPVYNDPDHLQECLAALREEFDQNAEILVVDDASTDDTAAVATRSRVTVLRLTKNSGPAAARNYGAQHARGEILFFVDADVVITRGTRARLLSAFRSQLELAELAAVFGSYDATPRSRSLVSRYRNLLHHFVHQNGNPDASTFWAGCGAVRKSVFLAVGGFDDRRFRKASIEDIELGYRLRHAGYRILLEKSLQGTHLKEWTLRSVLWTDIFCRAIPWSQLMITRPQAVNDLNLSTGQRVSVVLVAIALVALVGALFQPALLLLTLVTLLAVGVLNRALYVFFFRQHGLLFAGLCIPLHLLYYVCSGGSYGYVRILTWLKNPMASLFPTPVRPE